MANTTFTIQNFSPSTTATIRYIDFGDDPNVQHTADLSTLGGSGSAAETGTTTQGRLNKTYEKSSLIRRSLLAYTKPESPYFVSYTGTTLVVTSTAGIESSWASSGNQYNGMHVISVISATWLSMSSEPISAPSTLYQINFTSSTNRVTISNTAGISLGWQLSGNGYTSGQYVIQNVDATTLYVSAQPTTTPNLGAGQFVSFSTSTYFITLNNNTGLETGWIASSTDGNWNGQYVTAVVSDGQTVTMSAQPNGYANVGDNIKFVSGTAIGTVPPASSVTFTMDYTRVGSAGVGRYAASATIFLTQGTPITKYINNEINIILTPPVPVPYFRDASGIYYVYTGGRGGGGGGWAPAPNGCPSIGDPSAPNTSQSCTAASFGTSASSAPSPGDGDGDGDGGDGGPSSCFLPDAIILMADGSNKKLIDLRAGDLVVGAFGEINPVIGIYYHPIGNTLMYKINNDHDCTDDEVFVTTDRDFYCINPSDNDSYSHDGWGDSYLIHLENGISEMRTPPWSLGLISRPLHKVELGIKLQTTSGERILDSYGPYQLPPETVVYNCVVGGSHTLMINGYAHTAWARDDDFDYDKWTSTVIELTVEDYRNPIS